MRSQADCIREPDRTTPVVDATDVIVCGAGPAGIAAAITAARCGATVRLIEVHGCLGGVWTAGLLAWLFEMDQPGLTREITRTLDARGARRGSHPAMYSYEIEEMKLLLEEMCLAAGVRLRLHTRAVAVSQNGNRRVDAVITESKSGREAWRAKCFVDATGDGDLGALAGCGFDLGRPGSGQCQPMTYMALMAVRDVAAVGRFVSFYGGVVSPESHNDPYRGFLAEIRRAGPEPSYGKPTLFQVRGNLLALMVNHEYGVLGTSADDLTAATLRGRAEVNRVVRGLRELGGVWEDLTLVATCEQIGVREGRRIHGRYTVATDDLAHGARHPDAVCRASFGVDVHCTDPTTGTGQEPAPFATQPYDIPYRSLIARDVPNLLLAGRCISGDFIAHSSYRVTGVAAALGQAAGAAAALSAQQDCTPAEVSWECVSEALRRSVGFLPPS